LEKRNIFVPTRIWTLNHPDGGIDAKLTMLPWPQNFTPEETTKARPWSLYPLEKNLIPHCIGDWVGPSTILVWCRKSSAYNGIQSLDPPVCRKSLYPTYCPGQQNIKNKIYWEHQIHKIQLPTSGIYSSYFKHVINLALLMKSWSWQDPSQKGQDEYLRKFPCTGT
jgi:hypothetical protein